MLCFLPKRSPLLLQLFRVCMLICCSLQLIAQNAQKLDSLHQALQLANDDSTKVLLLCELSGQLAELDSAKALNYADQAIALSKKLDYQYGLGYATHVKGAVYDYNYSFTNALTCYHQALKIKEKNGDISGMAATYAGIGIVFYYQKKQRKAIYYYQKAADKRIEAQDSFGLASVYTNMAVSFRMLENYDTAKILYLKAIDIREKLDNASGLAYTYSNLGSLYRYLGEFDLALDYEYKALAIEKQLNRIRGIAQSFVSIAAIYQEKKDWTKAREFLNEGIVWGDSIPNYEVLSNAHHRLSIIDSIQGNINSAFQHFKKHISYKNLLFENKEKTQIEVLQTIYETEKKDREIEVQSKENQILNQQNKLQARSIQFWVIIAIAIAVLLALLASLYVMRLRNTRMLRQKNEQITLALAEKELLLKEIHHRVKNNLQIVSGLLHWQSMQTGDESIKKTVQEGKNRLKSMAMIHQRLYNENLKSIPLKNYIAELFEELKNSYGSKNVILEDQIEDIQLDVDTMVPLGLILTELMSNAFKHAFEDGTGKLIVDIHQENEQLLVQLQDDGTGFKKKEHTESSFGLKLVNTLAEKLDAQLKIYQKSGTHILLKIKKYKLHQL